MVKFLDICKALALLSVCTLCIIMTVLVHKATISLDQVGTTITKANTAVDNLNMALTTVNRPETGTLAEVNKSVLAFKSVLVHTDLVIDHENKQLSTLDNHERTLFSNGVQLFSNLNSTVHQGQETMLAAQESLQNASSLFATTETTILGVRPVLGHVDESVVRFNSLLANPAVPATMKSVQDITFHAARISDTADQVTAKATHSYLHPSTNIWARGWNATSPWLLPALKIAASVAP